MSEPETNTSRFSTYTKYLFNMFIKIKITIKKTFPYAFGKSPFFTGLPLKMISG